MSSSPKKAHKKSKSGNEDPAMANGASSPKKENKPKKKKEQNDVGGGPDQKPPPSPKPGRSNSNSSNLDKSGNLDKSNKNRDASPGKRGSSPANLQPAQNGTAPPSPTQNSLAAPSKGLTSSPSQASLSSSRKDGQEENVKVAVRVRPFNKREQERKATLIVEMKGSQTVLKNASEPNKDHTFAFDFSYWSHDGCKENADGYWEPDPSNPNSSKYCDQKRVFNDLGVGMLTNAWDGYNSTLFAYGQTGSGKSYSVIGWNANKGIVPMFCEQLFSGITDKKSAKADTTFEVMLSMLEIYNEVARDLLNPGGDKKNGLKIRENPKKGFYAENLTQCPVDSYKTIEAKMNEGTKNRTIASTNMNETSSRAHTIVCITFCQKRKNDSGQEMAKTSVNNLVDLAGSERVASTGATGDRLKEGAAINQSLSALGNCISALADQSQGKKVKIPYRDSTLTKLLMNALGGNSKTIMVAAISPADINYDETLSTLRYADRTKQIKTKAFINEDPTEKLIRDLQEENARLKAALKGGGGSLPDGSDDDYKAQLVENQRQMDEMKKSFEEKLAQASKGGSVNVQAQADIDRRKQKYPHLYNLNGDDLLNGMVVFIITPGGKFKIGNQRGDKIDFLLRGPSIKDVHGYVSCNNDMTNVTMERANEKAKILLNGQPLTAAMELHHNDRILIGSTQLFVFANPAEAGKASKPFPPVTYEMAQEEIARNSGFDMNRNAKSDTDVELQHKLVEVMPAIEQANAISEALDKMVKFEMVLVRPEALGKPATDPTEIYVRWRNFVNNLQFDWPMDKFMSRFYRMQELYDDFEEDGVVNKVAKDADPFIEPLDTPVRIGVGNVYLKSVMFRVTMRSSIHLIDIRLNEVGLLSVELVPCDDSGKEIPESLQGWMDHPESMLGKDVKFALKIMKVGFLPQRYYNIQCKYKVYNDTDYISTQVAPNPSNPEFNHSKVFSFKMDVEFLKYLTDGSVLMEVWGMQKPLQNDVRGNTQQVMESEAKAKANVSALNTNQRIIDPLALKLQMDVEVLEKRHEKFGQKLLTMRELVHRSEQKNITLVPLQYIKGVLEAPSTDVLNKLISKYSDDRDSGLSVSQISGGGGAGGSATKSRACVIS